MEPLRFRESTSLSEKDKNVCALLFLIVFGWWGGIVSTYIISYWYCMFLSYLIDRPKRFCPLWPFWSMWFLFVWPCVCVWVCLCATYTLTLWGRCSWILSICVSVGCYLQIWCVNVWNHVCIRWEHENSKSYFRSAWSFPQDSESSLGKPAISWCWTPHIPGETRLQCFCRVQGWSLVAISSTTSKKWKCWCFCITWNVLLRLNIPRKK